jgi:hypothetical protein
MEDEKLVRGVDRCQQLKVEPDLAEILMTELLTRPTAMTTTVTASAPRRRLSACSAASNAR